MDRKRLRVEKKRQVMDKVTRVLIALFAVLALVTAVVAFIAVRNLVSSWTMTSLPGAPVDGGSDPSTVNPNLPTTPLQPEGTGPKPPSWDGGSRVTILVMGLDFRDWEAGSTASRTDSMMLFTVDPITKTAGLLSIPRDMWVNIPGFDYGKINTAYFLGEANKLPGGGPSLAVETVKNLIGVPINFYAQIDFAAFVKVIDDLGGLDVTIYEPITIDPIGSGNTVTLKPGAQPLDGAKVLAYARARHTANGDFDRAKRQQEIVMDIRQQILTLKELPTLMAKAPQIYNDVASGIRTNLNLQQIIKLGYLAMQVPRDSIRQEIIDDQDVVADFSPDGQAILKPLSDKIRIKRDLVFASDGPLSPVVFSQSTTVGYNGTPTVVPADPSVLVNNEKAKVSVQNGTSREGLASKAAAFFKSQGMNVVEEKNADQVYAQSTLIDYTGKPFTMSYLAKLLNVPTDHIFSRFDPNSPADVAVILGTNSPQEFAAQ